MYDWVITEDKVVSDYEKDLLLAAAKNVADKQMAVMMWVLLNTGLRVQELCDLRVCDLPCVHKSYAIIVRRGKRGKRRSVPVSRQFAEKLEEYVRDYRPATLPRRLGKKSLDGWLFYINGKQAKTWQIRYRIEKLARQAGIERGITPHMFRHRFATYALNQDGSNIYKLKVWMGHSSMGTTEKYLHLASMLRGQDGELLEQVMCS